MDLRVFLTPPRTTGRAFRSTLRLLLPLGLLLTALPVTAGAQQAPPPPADSQYPPAYPAPGQYPQPPQPGYAQSGSPDSGYPDPGYSGQQPPDHQFDHQPDNQSGPPPGMQPDATQYPQQGLAPEQLEQLVAPIALYPDNLVAQVLAASTWPMQVAEADHWRSAQGDAPPQAIAAAADAQNWDPSVKALTAFPQVLAQLDRNLDWTTALGNAYYNQPQDLLSAVQTMRQRAAAAGNLRNTPQETVSYDQGYIQLQPANPQIVYVPAWNPWTVYGDPVAPYPGFSLLNAVGSFFGSSPIQYGLGMVMSAFTNVSWGWLGWGLNWLTSALLFHHDGYYSHSPSLVDWGLRYGGPRWHGNYAYGRGYGRDYGHGFGGRYDRAGYRGYGGNNGRGGSYGRSYGGGYGRGYGHGYGENGWRGAPTARMLAEGGTGYRGGHQISPGGRFNPTPLTARNNAGYRSGYGNAAGYGSRSAWGSGYATRGGYGSTYGRSPQTYSRSPQSYARLGQFSGRMNQNYGGNSRSWSGYSSGNSGRGSFSRPSGSSHSGGFHFGGGGHSQPHFGGSSHSFGGGHSGGHFGGGGGHSGGGHSGGHSGGGHHR